MEFGVCGLSIIPMRGSYSHKSEMVSQLLFGETCKVVKTRKDWLFIETTLDTYTGWVQSHQLFSINENNYNNINKNTLHFSKEIVYMANSIHKQHPVLMGSPLPYFRSKQFSLFDDKFRFEGKTINLEKQKPTAEKVTEAALNYLDAPYLWGGRTPLGIDCSGFAQMVFRLCNIHLPRDSKMQAKVGEKIASIKEAKTGDLAFFHNEIGEVCHVGIMLNNNQIIHSFGRVRIDSISKDGIFNNSLQKITHKLIFIHRYF